MKAKTFGHDEKLRWREVQSNSGRNGLGRGQIENRKWADQKKRRERESEGEACH